MERFALLFIIILPPEKKMAFLPLAALLVPFDLFYSREENGWLHALPLPSSALHCSLVLRGLSEDSPGSYLSSGSTCYTRSTRTEKAGGYQEAALNSWLQGRGPSVAYIVS
jgi:hypothetical protein